MPRRPLCCPGQASTPFRLIAAAFTPFHPDGSINLTGIDGHVELLLAQGIGDAFVCGTTGEGASLSSKERRVVAERFVTAAAGRLRIIVHVGHAATVEAQALAAHAKRIGADAIAAVPPFYFRPGTELVAVDTVAEIAAGAPNLPFFYYHIPAITGVRLPMATFLAGATRRIPNFAGIKFTDEDLADYAACLETATPDQQIFFGRDEILMSGLALGAHGAVGTTYSFAAGLYAEITNAFASGDLDTARKTQQLARSMIDTAKQYGGLPALKAIMAWAGVDCGPCRLPLQTLDAAAITSLRHELAELGVLGYLESVAG